MSSNISRDSGCAFSSLDALAAACAEADGSPPLAGVDGLWRGELMLA